MFNLRNVFAKKENPLEVVAKIHAEFDAATDNILKQANDVLSGIKDCDKGERLSKVGFVSSAPAVEAVGIKKTKEQMEKVARLVSKYSNSYPNNKFITEEVVVSICKKYGLVFGGVGAYIGDVPEKNLREIEAFKLKEEDCVEHFCGYYKRVSFNSNFMPRYSLSHEKTDIYGYVDYTNWRSGEILQRAEEGVKKVYTSPPLMICAPIKDFDMNRMRVQEEGYRLEMNIPDPVVLQPVDGGYLIVSKWGLEANDQSLVNENHN